MIFTGRGYRLHFAKGQLARLGNLVVPAKPVNAIAADPDDNMILECAVEAGSDFIITADNHLLRLGQYEGIPIIRPEDFLKRAGRGAP